MILGPDIQGLREEIEQVDRRLLRLLRQRMELVDRIATAKIKAASPFRDHQREEQVLQRVRGAAVEQGLDPHPVERLYRLIMEMSISRQQAFLQSLSTAPLRVAYQGVEGSYSHLTAQRRYRGREGGVLLTGHETVSQAAGAVRSGAADVAFLPIENSTAGSINETYDALAEGGLTIAAEVIAEVEHCLVALPGTRLEDLARVISHPQALSQCQDFLAGLGVRTEAEFDTAGAARKVKVTGDRTLAAIASESAAQMLGLEVLRKGIQMQAGNATRFVEVAIEGPPCPADAACKTSLLLTLGDWAGGLGEVLIQFGRRDVKLAKLESRPMAHTPWKYRFYLDVEAHADDEPMVEALEAVRPMVAEVRILGTYPMALTPPGPPTAGSARP